jgi:hypothetical protein
MSRIAPEQWPAHLRRIAEPCARLDAPLALGELEAPFRAAACGQTVAPPAQPADSGEIGLWWALTDARVDVDRIVARRADGPIMSQGAFMTIEVWADAELSALHALWWLARRRNRNDWRQRLSAARDWHVINTQPDNATNRPWALHVFLIAGRPECTHYAETLLSNCQALHGRPDTLSAWILLDAARAIEDACAGDGSASTTSPR